MKNYGERITQKQFDSTLTGEMLAEENGSGSIDGAYPMQNARLQKHVYLQYRLFILEMNTYWGPTMCPACSRAFRYIRAGSWTIRTNGVLCWSVVSAGGEMNAEQGAGIRSARWEQAALLVGVSLFVFYVQSHPTYSFSNYFLRACHGPQPGRAAVNRTAKVLLLELPFWWAEETVSLQTAHVIIAGEVK